MSTHKKYNVIVLPEAQQDIREIVLYMPGKGAGSLPCLHEQMPGTQGTPSSCAVRWSGFPRNRAGVNLLDCQGTCRAAGRTGSGR